MAEDSLKEDFFQEAEGGDAADALVFIQVWPVLGFSVALQLPVCSM